MVNWLGSWINSIRRATPKKVANALLTIGCHSIFWGWNGLFLLVVYLGFLPLIGVPLIGSLVSGEVPFPFVIPLVSFLAVPPVCTVVGLFKLRKRPSALMRLFYGVEAPIMALCVLRMFVLRELTPASALMVVAGALAIATVALELVFGYAAYSKPLARFQIVAHTVALLMGIGVGGVLLFYTVPILWTAIWAFVRLEWVGAIAQQVGWLWQSYQPQGLLDWVGMVLSTLFQSALLLGILALFGFSLTLFVGMPHALVVLFSQSWGRIRFAFGQQFGRRVSWLYTGGVVAAFGVLFLLTLPQPQVRAFALLNQPPDSAAARQVLVRLSPQIRQGLLNAYLMQYRYISTWQSANNLEVWYPSVFPISSQQARFFQRWHNALLSPFLYQGDRTDPEKAAELYANFFDTPIQKAESEAIQHALRSTVERDSVEASLLNISDHAVALARQEVTVEAAGDWAEITLYERYENGTPDDQEIVYQFSLPESAVFTGLWLAEGNMAERFRFVVSPRGAAQQVYRQELERAEVTRAEDPALLEQVGPRQYRLRVFPIPRRTGPGNPGITHLWMTYRVPQQNGAWPLPQLTEKRNLYWTDETERVRLGQTVASQDMWYEAAIPAESVVAPQTHQATLPEGYTVTATPMPEKAIAIHNQRFALIVDTSRSMKDRVEDLAAAIATVAPIVQNNTVDWFITSAEGVPAQKLSDLPRAKDLSFYGSLPLTTQLQQFDALRNGAAYDAILMLTDAGNYELESDQSAIADLPGALWIVHLGGVMPTAYTDSLLPKVTRVRSGVAEDVGEALRRFALEQATGDAVVDGYRWAITPAMGKTPVSAAAFEPVAARQVIRWLSQHRDVTQLAELDRLHAIAQRSEVVTPYSSMLVLVNDRQREALAAAENDADRFEREVETGEDVLTNPGDPLNASVPDRGTPLALLLLGGVLGLAMLRSRGRSLGRNSPL